MVVARASGAGVQVVLEVGVAPGRLYDRLDRLLGKNRPAQVGVEDDPGSVYHAAEAPAGENPDGHGDDGSLRSLGLLAGPDLPPQMVQSLSDSSRGGSPVASGQRLAGLAPQHRVHGRQRPQPLPLPRFQHTRPSITRPCSCKASEGLRLASTRLRSRTVGVC